MHRRLRVPGVLLAAVLLPAGCGGGHGPAPRTPTATATAPASPAPPTYTAAQVTASLPTARQIGPRVARITPDIPAFRRNAVPSCSLSVIEPSGHPSVTVREFSPGQYKGTNFGQTVLTYPDAATAAAMFATIRAKTAACPAKRHIVQKTVAGGRRFVVTHDDTWRTAQDTVLGWAHVRGTEKDVYPPSSSIINVILFAYDYARRGNVVIASMYWERVKPSASETAVAGQATRLLTAQLRKLG